MGKYIVLKIDDDECVQSLLNEPPQGAEVIGSFMMPTQFCNCTDILIKDDLVKPGEFVRGKKFGLYVHKKCKLPRAGHSHYMKNLLLETHAREGFGLTVTMTHPYTPYKKFGGVIK